jgi:quercetin dioxygenase-like cupin family protein
MKTQYKFTADKAKKFNKHGVDLTVYGENVDQVNVVNVSVEKGHFQEFLNIRSWFVYYIYEGEGTFFLNDEKIEAKATDLIVIPPNTRIYYFGKMKMVLTVSPAFDEKDERHIRFVDKTESPYYNE